MNIVNREFPSIVYISFVWTMDSVRYDSKEERCFNLLKWMPIKLIMVNDSHAIVIYVHPNFVTLVACRRFRFSANATPTRIQSNFFNKSIPWVAPWTPYRASCAKVQYERFVCYFKLFGRWFTNDKALTKQIIML